MVFPHAPHNQLIIHVSTWKVVAPLRQNISTCSFGANSTEQSVLTRTAALMIRTKAFSSELLRLLPEQKRLPRTEAS